MVLVAAVSSKVFKVPKAVLAHLEAEQETIDYQQYRAGKEELLILEDKVLEE